MTRRRLALGRDGETHAARYLTTRGYRIVARNVRAARVEIDLIARRGRMLVFVEVKARRATGADGFGRHGGAAEAVDARKQARLRRGAQAWLASNPEERARAHRVRFDVITCLLEATPAPPAATSEAPEPDPRNDDTAPGGARWSLKHWEAAF